MKVITERLWLRPVNADDKDKLKKWRNAYREHFFSDDGKEISDEKHDRWFKQYTSLPPGTDLMFIAVKLGTTEEIGTIALYDINIDERMAVLGRVLILQQYQGHNYAQEMVNAIRDLAFNTIRLHRLIVETDLMNTKAQHIYFTSGFKTIGQRFIPATKYLFRIITILEMLNPDHDLKKPLRIESYEADSPSGYEGQCDNVK